MKAKGFTIVELLIYIGLLMIFLAVLTGIFTSTLDVELRAQTSSAVSQDSRYMLARLSYDVERATAVIIPVSEGATGNTLGLVINGVSYTYSVTNGFLELTNANGTDQLNGFGTTVSNFAVTRLGNPAGLDSVQIRFTVTGTTVTTGIPESRSFQLTAGIR